MKKGIPTISHKAFNSAFPGETLNLMSGVGVNVGVGVIVGVTVAVGVAVAVGVNVGV